MKTTILSFICLFFSTCLLTAQAGRLDSTFNQQGFNTFPLEFNYPNTEAISIHNKQVLVLTRHIALDTNSDADILLHRFLEDGQIDLSFGQAGELRLDLFDDDHGFDLTTLPNGKIIVAASLTSDNLMALIQLEPDGSRDTSFGSQGVSLYDHPNKSGTSRKVLVQDDGKILLVGTLNAHRNNAENIVIRFTPDGIIDTTFGQQGITTTPIPGETFYTTSALLSPKGNIIISGFRKDSITNNDLVLLQLLPNGQLDLSFGNQGIMINDLDHAFQKSADIALQSDGKIIHGFTQDTFPEQQNGILRYLPNGQIDHNFGDQGFQLFQVSSEYNTTIDVEVQKDDKLILAVLNFAFPTNVACSIIRLSPEGTMDLSFGENGRTEFKIGHRTSIGAMMLQSDEKIVVGGIRQKNGELSVVAARFVNTLTSVSTQLPVQQTPAINIYPNPIHHSFTLQYQLQEASRVRVQLYDAQGKWLKELRGPLHRNPGSHEEQFNLSPGMVAGLYIVVVETNQGKGMAKILVE